MIEVYNTIIDERELIGVGPLRVKRSTSAETPNDKEYYFSICTKHTHFVITTDWLPFVDNQLETSVREVEAITEAHKALKNCLVSGSFTELSVTSDPNY